MKDFIKQRLHEEISSHDKVFYHGSPYVFDKFDFDKIGSGDGMAKFGHGIYFADEKDTATYYAKELSIGDLKKGGFNLYTVRLHNLGDFYQWEDETPQHIAECVVRKLYKLGHSDDADQIKSEYEEYGNYWEVRNIYEVLTHILGSKKVVSEMLSICGLAGVIGKSPMHDGLVYTVYDDNVIRIVDIEKLK